MCDCPSDVRDVQTIRPAPGAVGVRSVVLMICDCDRRTCPVNGCYAKVGPGLGQWCTNGHKS